MPQSRSWEGEKIVGKDVLAAYIQAVNEQIAASKTDTLAAVDKKDQNLMTDVEGKIQTAVDKAAADVGQDLTQVESDLKAADQTLQQNIDEVGGGLSALSKHVETLPDVDTVNTAIANALTSFYQFKGSVADYASLPTGYGPAQAGWVYNTEDTGMNYAWTGSKWDSLGGDRIVTQMLTSSEYNTILNNATIPEGAEGKLVGADAYLGLRNKVVDLVPPSGLPLVFGQQTILQAAWTQEADGRYKTVYQVDNPDGPQPDNYNFGYLLVVITNRVGPESTVTLDSVYYNTVNAPDAYVFTFYSLIAPPSEITFNVYRMTTILTGGALMYSQPSLKVDLNAMVNDASGRLKAVTEPTAVTSSGVVAYAMLPQGLSSDKKYLLVITGSGENLSTVGYRYVIDNNVSNGEYTPYAVALYSKVSGLVYKYQLFELSAKDPADQDTVVVLNACSETRSALPIAEGGTGGTTAANAMKNLIVDLPDLDSVSGPHAFNNMHIPFTDKVNNATEYLSVLDILTWASNLSTGYRIFDANTDYTTPRARAISLHTALPSTLVNGFIYGIYT